jgi:hypothetical protein
MQGGPFFLTDEASEKDEGFRNDDAGVRDADRPREVSARRPADTGMVERRPLRAGGWCRALCVHDGE